MARREKVEKMEKVVPVVVAQEKVEELARVVQERALVVEQEKVALEGRMVLVPMEGMEKLTQPCFRES